MVDSPPTTVVDHIEKMLLDDMLNDLSNTPLQRTLEDGRTIDETQRIFWTIDFILKTGEKRGLKLDWG